jgi:3-phenylpropionate/trans-cinnamate dioxygenase beta subunit
MMNGSPVSNDIYLDLQRQLYQEARLLSAEQYDDWLLLVCNDIQYEMEVPQRRFREDKSRSRAPVKTPIFNDDMASILMRINRFKTGFVWSENPINAIRHIVSNIEAFHTDIPEQYLVYSVVEVHRSRLDSERKRLTAGRKDLWNKTETGYKLLNRTATLDDSVVLDSNINYFF